MTTAASHFRAHARRPSDAQVQVVRDGVEQAVRLVDLGLGGAGLEGMALVVGSRVHLVLSSPSRWDPLVLPARVAWATGTRCGVAFEPASDRDLFALHELLGTQVFDI